MCIRDRSETGLRANLNRPPNSPGGRSQKYYEAKASWTQIFDALDNDQNGNVDLSELVVGLTRGVGSHTAELFAGNYLKRFDADNDGQITLEEWLQVLVPETEHSPRHALRRTDLERYFKETGMTVTPPRLQQMWDQDLVDRETAVEAFSAVWEHLDENGDGGVTVEELRSALLAGWGSKVALQHAIQLMKQSDTDSDGNISLEEWNQLFDGSWDESSGEGVEGTMRFLMGMA
eukprot:TRINITY_DN22423_c0_g1_i2.p1 TRINITY_DN22423_c0_g1~~TRINITY_DN22423_c0_g1_i2.p1  ORF type:complete len:233 (-),score=54.72 TRINITY_DN22423_c0_g1_i2:239-937(-)